MTRLASSLDSLATKFNWHRAFWPGDWKTERLITGGRLPKQHLLCRENFIAWRLRCPNGRIPTGSSIFAPALRMSLDSCIAFHVKMTLCHVLPSGRLGKNLIDLNKLYLSFSIM